MAKFKVFQQIDVALLEHQYPIIITDQGLHNPLFLHSFVLASQVLIVTNETVEPLYLHFLENAFSHLQCDTLVLPDGEMYKNQESLFLIYDALIQKNHHRDTTIIALGGGVIGDLAGFAASTYQRGVRFIQIPTTLLAQVDASVGGKTAINHVLAKNMIGSFYQPSAVIIDLSTLNTLPKREFCAGLGEIIKYGLLKGGVFYNQLIQDLQAGSLIPGSTQLADCIATCCRIKADYVEEDEKDEGQRALLNLGHTFAHALESYTHYQRWLHGEAVAIGLYCAAVMSWKLGDWDYPDVLTVKTLLECAGLPYKIPEDIDLDGLCIAMKLDKKIKNNTLGFVLIKAAGHCYLNYSVTETCLRETLMAVVEGEC